MVVGTIYVVRHGFRMNWAVNPTTGDYSSLRPTPTGIPSDPELASKGVEQSKELAQKLISLDPKIDVVYSSPFYRCLQTIKPTLELMIEQDEIIKTVRVENGIGEFYGTARFHHPSPATLDILEKHFKFLNTSYTAKVVPHSKGESIEELHERIADAVSQIIEDLDSEPGSPKTVLLVSHAAVMICLGRALTGNMPEDINEEDFRCGTCALSKYVRRTSEPTSRSVEASNESNVDKPENVPKLDWKGGKGVQGGWDCIWNGDCSFLSGGEERTWNFYMEPSAGVFKQGHGPSTTVSTPPRPLSPKDPNTESCYAESSAAINDMENFFANPETIAEVVKNPYASTQSTSSSEEDTRSEENSKQNQAPAA